MQQQAPGAAPRINNIQFPAATSVAFDLQAFLDGIKAHGLRFVHWRGMKDPVGLIDKYDSRRPNPNTPLAVNGMYYSRAGIVTALCISNTKETKASDAGIVDASTAQFTPLNEYEDTGKRVFLAPMDRLFLDDESVLVSRHELLEASPTGIDRPKFPVAEVLDCVDAKGIVYHQCVDFEVDSQGLIHWKDKRPGQDVETGKGVIYGIRYVYKPHWYVDRLIHEIRMIQQENFMTGERTMTQAPQSALIRREYFYESEAADSGTRAAEEGPPDGQLPAR
jgi:hypothetical protein